MAVTLFTMSWRGENKLEKKELIIENIIPNSKSDTCPAPNPLTKSRRTMSSPVEGVLKIVKKIRI